MNQIVPAALNTFSDLSSLEAGIGPHITQESFVVSKDTAVQLSMSSPQGKKSVFEAGGQKYRASLIDLVKSQIAHRISVKAWWNLPLNTFSSNLFYSFRRTAEKTWGSLALSSWTKGFHNVKKVAFNLFGAGISSGDFLELVIFL